MQRAAEVDGEEISDIDQRADRAQPDGGQPVLQPLRARTVLDPAHGAPEHPGAGVRHLNRPGHGAGAGGRDRWHLQPPERAKPSRRKIPRDTTHAQRVTAIGGDGDIDHRVVHARPGRVGHADRGVGGQVDDAGMIVANAHLAHRQQHALGLHAADFADLQRHVGAGDIEPSGGKDALHASARIRRAAHDGVDLRAVIDLAHPQPVGIGVLHRLDHMGDAECGQRGAAILHALEFEADHGQRIGDFGQGGGGVEMGLEPGERELHLTPPRAAWRQPAG